MPRPSLLLAASLAALGCALGCGSSVTTVGDAGAVVDAPMNDAPRVDAPVVDRVVVDAPPMDAPPDDAPARDVPATGRVPLRHRAAAVACPAERPASTCMGGFGPPTACASDGECTAGTNGRCVGNPHDGCRCNYDTCANDGQCTTGGPCECRLASRGASGANVCLGGNCQVDADCGAGGYCSPTLGDCGNYGGLVGYYCHTPADECVDDADCRGGDAGFLGQLPYCMYSRVVGRWRCSNQGCAG